MSSRLKIHALMISTAVLITIMAGPPLAFAVNLPTICNVFHKSQNPAKSGHCAAQSFLSKLQTKSFEGGMAHALVESFGIPTSAISQEVHSFPLVQSPAVAQFNPLRC